MDNVAKQVKTAQKCCIKQIKPLFGMFLKWKNIIKLKEILKMQVSGLGFGVVIMIVDIFVFIYSFSI